MTCTPACSANSRCHHLIALAQPQQTVIHEHASELGTDGARCNSAASTEESTPPDSPSNTLSVPHPGREFRATLSSMILPVAQFAEQFREISRTKRVAKRSHRPCRLCVTSGWNCGKPEPARDSSADRRERRVVALSQ